MGEVSHLDVADMHEQVLARSDRLAERRAAAPDSAAARSRSSRVRACGALYESLGVAVLGGGQTLNPSTYELLAGIHEVPAQEVVVLPNSPNVVMAAEHAAELSDKVVRVSAVRSQQAGLSAALALDPTALRRRTSRRSTPRSRSCGREPSRRQRAPTATGRFGVGEAVGFVDDTIVAWGDPEETLRAVLGELAGGAELLTCIAGEGAPLDEAGVRALGPGGVELECEVGGQPSYWWLVAAE